MKADGIGFAAAFALLDAETRRHGDAEKKIKTENQRPKTDDSEAMTKSEAEYLEKAAAYYHKSLLKNEKAIAYLQSRGITPEAMHVFQLGFVDGSLKDKTSADGKANLESLGILNERGNETMFGSVVFPLVDANSNQAVGLYARHIEKKQHLYLAGKRRGGKCVNSKRTSSRYRLDNHRFSRWRYRNGIYSNDGWRLNGTRILWIACE